MTISNCSAKRVNDEMHCGKCSMQWDIDEDPPYCERNDRPWIRRLIAELELMLTPVDLPPMKHESLRYKNKMFVITLSDGAGRHQQLVGKKYADVKRDSLAALAEFNK